MIKLQNQVPSIYPSASRDFQYLGWLADIVLNSVKHNVDDLYQLPILDSDAKLTELLAMTLGFKVRRNYEKEQLAALVGVLPTILRYKGTEKAIKMAADALIKASGAPGSFKCSVDGAQIQIVLPETLVDVTLFTDLLDYILPAGMTYRIVRSTQDDKKLDDILVGARDIVKFEQVKDLEWPYSNVATGLATLFDVDAQTNEFAANFIPSEDGYDYTLNSGLLSNTVIPVLATDTPSIPAEELLYINMVDRDGNVLVSDDAKVLLGKE
jgi:hypothetical protein